MKLFAVICALGFYVPLVRADFSTGFGDGYDQGGDVSGQNGWSITDPTPNLSFFVRMNGSEAAALGGFYNRPMGPAAVLSHPVGIPLSGLTFKVSLALLPSTNHFPGHDVFGWTLAGPEGESLFSLYFLPVAGNSGYVNVAWRAGSGAMVATGLAISYSAPYSIDLRFNPLGAGDLGFVAVITGTNILSFNGSVPGLAGKTCDSLGAVFRNEGASFGDNFMVFDDLRILPLSILDADGDGYSAETEEWFGTSDASKVSSPAPKMSLTSGAASLMFPSVTGNKYVIEWSEDLVTWTSETITAVASTTTWSDAGLSASSRRLFRIRKP